MTKKIILDEYEQDIEDNIEKQLALTSLTKDIDMIREAARHHVKRKKSITVRVRESDLEAMKFKASKIGVPYQTYINMLIHRAARTL